MMRMIFNIYYLRLQYNYFFLTFYRMNLEKIKNEFNPNTARNIDFYAHSYYFIAPYYEIYPVGLLSDQYKIWYGLSSLSKKYEYMVSVHQNASPITKNIFWQNKLLYNIVEHSNNLSPHKKSIKILICSFAPIMPKMS